jgi:hypothetical protein
MDEACFESDHHAPNDWPYPAERRGAMLRLRRVFNFLLFGVNRDVTLPL